MGLVKLNDIVTVQGKECQGTVAFIGTTSFSTGKWIGVILDEPLGKNNGSVQGKKYFTCEDNHGVFVRETQLSVVSRASNDDDSIMNTSTSSLKSESGSSIMNKSEDTNKSLISDQSKSPRVAPRPERSSVVEPPVQPSRVSLAPTQKPLPIVEDSDRNMAPIEVAVLKQEIKDLNEKLETIMSKRAEDREKLREAEKLKVQYNQIEENRKILQDKNSQLLRDLEALKKEKNDVQVAYNNYREEMTEIQETIELSTLDKEMAEAKFDEAQFELKSAQDKLEELQLENEILKEELQLKETEAGSGTGDGSTNSVEMKQLVQKNEMLKDALIKLRDLTNQDKYQISLFEREIETLRKENEKLINDKLHLEEQIKNTEEGIIELREQADAALGSDAILAQLTERNLSLEEQLEELKEERDTYEALCETNDEFIENQKSHINDLKDEIQSLENKKIELFKIIEIEKEKINDYENTFVKFRELITDLQSENSHLKESLDMKSENENLVNNMPSSKTQEVIELKTASPNTLIERISNISEGKQTFGKFIENELRKFDLEQSLGLISILNDLTPTNFTKKGSDFDSIHVYQIIEKLSFKCELISGQLKERNPLPSYIPGQANTIASILANEEGTENIQTELFSRQKSEFYSFTTSLVSIFNHWQMLLQQSKRFINKTDLKTFSTLATYLEEFEKYETSINTIINLAKKDQLDENCSMEHLLVGVLSLKTWYTTNMLRFNKPVEEQVNIHNCSSLMADFIKFILASTDSLCTLCVTLCGHCDYDIGKMNEIFEASNVNSQSNMDRVESIEEVLNNVLEQQHPGSLGLLQELIRVTAILRNRARSIRRRLPSNPSEQNLIFSNDVARQIFDICIYISTLVSVLHGSVKCAAQISLKKVETHGVLTFTEISNDCIHTCTQRELANLPPTFVAGNGFDNKLKNMLINSTRMLHTIAVGLEHGDFDSDDKEAVTQNPMELLAANYKEAQVDLEASKNKVKLKEFEINELQLTIRSRMSEISDLKVKMSSIEKKLDNAAQGCEGKLIEMQKQYELLQVERDDLRKEFERKIEILQQEIKEHEESNYTLKSKLQESSKAALLDGIIKANRISSQHEATPTTNLKEGHVIGKDDQLITKENRALKFALKKLISENETFKAKELNEKIRQLGEPLIRVPNRHPPSHGGAQGAEETYQMLVKRGHEVVDKLKLLTIQGPPIPRVDESPKVANDRLNDYYIKVDRCRRELDQVQHESNELLSKIIPLGQRSTCLKTFPSSHAVTLLSELASKKKEFDDAVQVMRIKVNRKLLQQAPNLVPWVEYAKCNENKIDMVLTKRQLDTVRKTLISF